MSDPLSGFFGCGCENLDWSFKRTWTIDEAGEDNTRTNLGSSGDLVTKFRQIVDRVPKIAYRRHPSGNVEERGHFSQMCVHIPQAGQDHLAFAVDHLHAGGVGPAVIRLDTDNTVTLHRDALVRHEVPMLGVEDSHIANDQTARRPVGERFGEFGRSSDFDFALRFLERVYG